MIAHFQGNRAQIEELTNSFRRFEPTDEVRIWSEIPENIEKMEAAGIKRIKSLGPMWFPDPYSVEGAKQFFEKIERERGIKGYMYQSIGVELVNDERPRTSFAHVLVSSGVQTIFKELIYYPEVPKIENGKLWWPVSRSGETWGVRIFSTLNDYPPDWKRGECVFREIDTHWFLVMCTAAI